MLQKMLLAKKHNMGVINFLKNKFGSKKKDDIVAYEKGLNKSKQQFAGKLKTLEKKISKIDNNYFSKIEEILIEADVGVELTFKIIDELLKENKLNHITDISLMNSLLIDKLFANYVKEEEQTSSELPFFNGKTSIVLIVGVNGVGKTTSIAKLANRYKNMNKRVLLIAADTFRAGAIEQLKIWAQRINVDIFVGNQNEDPASVIYKGLEKNQKEKYDLVLIDTAGRLQNKINLMKELGKIDKIIDKLAIDAHKETLLIIDATTGQNGVLQAKEFSSVSNINGIMLTKMDGTSKGGIILPIRDILGLKVKFIGFGEGINDIELFDVEKYLYSLCVDEDAE